MIEYSKNKKEIRRRKRIKGEALIKEDK